MASVIALALFLLLFNFLPTSIDEDAVLSGYLNTTSFAAAINQTSMIMMQDVSVLTAENSDEVKALDAKSPTRSQYLYEVCDVTDPFGSGTKMNPDKCTSEFASARAFQSNKPHGGTDLVSNHYKDKIVWHLALWSGTVVKSEYHNSYGRYVLIKADDVPNLYYLYAHMAPGNAKTYGGQQPSVQTAVNFPNGSSVLVKVGDHVNAGDKIGVVGTTGSSTGVHSHVELRLSPQGSSNCYRADVWKILNEGKKLSELEWVFYYYDGGVATLGDKLSSEDVEYLNSINVEEGGV